MNDALTLKQMESTLERVVNLKNASTLIDWPSISPARDEVLDIVPQYGLVNPRIMVDRASVFAVA